MKKILVPVDFTPVTRNASEYAALLAKAMGAEIHLLHVYKDPIPATVGPDPWSITIDRMQAQNEVHLKKEIDFLIERYSVQTDGELQRGFQANSINKISKEIAADLIVMGLKNDRRTKTSGSATLKTISKTNIPVMIIPEGTTFSHIKKIVLAVDFNEVTDPSCFEPLFDVIKAFDASLRVLHVEKRGADINAAEMPGKLELGRILGKISYFYDKIENDDVKEGILHFIQDHPTDLLVMIGHHHNFLERFFGVVYTNSISSDIITPLLIIKNN